MLTNQEIALLALLAEKDYYGYELEKTIEHRAMREWTELSISGIYKSLNKLELKDLVSSSREMTAENRLRKTYQITELGREALKTELEVLLRSYKQMKWPVDIGIYNLNIIGNEDKAELLKEYRENLQDKIDEYSQVEKCLQEDGCKYYQVAVVSRQLSIFKGEMIWLNSFINQLAER
ncbi:PadR family transcriptional regulator [Candidatus Cloacimonadota bacterium]